MIKSVCSVLIVAMFCIGGISCLNTSTAKAEVVTSPVIQKLYERPFEKYMINATFEGANNHATKNCSLNGKNYPIITDPNEQIPQDYKRIDVYFDKLSEEANINILTKLGAKQLVVYPQVIICWVPESAIPVISQTLGISYLSVLDGTIKPNKSIGELKSVIQSDEQEVEVINPTPMEYLKTDKIESNMKQACVIFKDEIDVQTRVNILEQMGGGNILMYKGHSLYSSVSVYIPENKLNNIRNHPAVLAADFDVNGFEPCAQSIGWAPKHVGAHRYWPQSSGDLSYNWNPPTTNSSGFKTERVTVAVIDTGCYYEHSDFTYDDRFSGVSRPASAGDGLLKIYANLNSSNEAYKIAGYDFWENDPWPGPGARTDVGDHGTWCSGIIGAANNTIGYLGVAPMVRLFALDVGYNNTVNDSHLYDLNAIVNSLNWCKDNRIHIVSMSFVGNNNYSTMYTAIHSAYSTGGCLLVASAGNSPGFVLYPALYDEVIAVGGVDDNNDLYTDSSYGSDLELAAPAVDVETLDIGGGYRTITGTSAAAPVVVGVAALYKSQNPKWTNVELRDELRHNALDLFGVGWDQFSGYGLVQAGFANQKEAEQYDSMSGVTIGRINSSYDYEEVVKMEDNGDWVQTKFTWRPGPDSGASTYARLIMRASTTNTGSGRIKIYVNGDYKGYVDMTSTGGTGNYKDDFTVEFDPDASTGSNTIKLELYVISGNFDVWIDRFWVEGLNSIEVENRNDFSGIDYIMKGGNTSGIRYSLFLCLYHGSDWIEIAYRVPPFDNTKSLSYWIKYTGYVAVYSGTNTIKVYIDGNEKLSFAMSTGYYDTTTLGVVTVNSGIHTLKVTLYAETGNTDLGASWLGIEVPENA